MAVKKKTSGCVYQLPTYVSRALSAFPLAKILIHSAKNLFFPSHSLFRDPMYAVAFIGKSQKKHW